MSEYREYLERARQNAQEREQGDRKLIKAVGEAGKIWRVGPFRVSWPTLYTFSEAEELGIPLFETEAKIRDHFKALALLEYTTVNKDEWINLTAEEKKQHLQKRVIEAEMEINIAEIAKFQQDLTRYFEDIVEVINLVQKGISGGGSPKPFRTNENDRSHS